VLVALHMAYQDGRDKYNGVLRYLNEDAAAAWDIHLLRAPPPKKLLVDVISPGIQGAIVSGGLDDDIFRLVAQSNVPCVAIDISQPAIPNGQPSPLAFVDIDSSAIGRRGAEYLLGQGKFNCFGFVGYPPDCRWSSERCAAFRTRLVELGLDCAELVLPYNPHLVPATHTAFLNWLRPLRKPVAILAANDELARLVLNICKQENIAVPNEVAVLGVDNEQIICTHTTPTLSSIQPDFEQAGYAAARLLQEMMNGSAPTLTRYIAPIKQVIGRNSTAPSLPTAKMVLRVEEYIRNHAGKTIHVADIAHHLNISRRLLDLRFRQVTGSTVLSAIQAARIERVAHLLRTTNLTITEISNVCEFNSENHLRRLFKKHTGYTMSDYRRSRWSPSYSG